MLWSRDLRGVDRLTLITVDLYSLTGLVHEGSIDLEMSEIVLALAKGGKWKCVQ